MKTLFFVMMLSISGAAYAGEMTAPSNCAGQTDMSDVLRGDAIAGASSSTQGTAQGASGTETCPVGQDCSK